VFDAFLVILLGFGIKLCMAYYVYILRMSDGRYYTGSSSNLNQRIIEHRRKNAAQTTDLFGADKLLYYEIHADRVVAEKRERQIKGWSQTKKTALVKGDLNTLKALSKRKSFK
jgi:putative endonuclease